MGVGRGRASLLDEAGFGFFLSFGLGLDFGSTFDLTPM